MHAGGLRLQATVYHNTIEDLITSRTLDASELPPGFFFGSRNINAGEARSQGLEVEADWNIGHGFSAAFAYTFADSQITENALDPASVGKQIGGVPRNRANLALTYESSRGMRLTPQVRWLEASFADNAHTLPVDEQTIVDLTVSYPLRDSLAVVAAPTAHAQAQTVRPAAVAVIDPWAAATPSAARTAAGYVTLCNTSQVADRLVSVGSPRAARVELHEMSVSGGVMRMRPLPTITIPAGGAAHLAPGGLHIMFVDIDAPFVEGQTIPVTLRFERQGAIRANFVVRRRGGSHAGH